MAARLQRSITAPDQEQIIVAAAHLFAERGFRNTTMQDLAARLEMAKPTLYARFTSKTDILQRIFEKFLSAAEEAVNGAADLEGPSEQLRYLILQFTRQAVDLAPFARVFNADERELPPHLVAEFRGVSLRMLDRLREIIHEGQGQGEFEPSVDATVTAFALLSLLNWTPRWYRIEGPRTLEEVADFYSTLILDGLRTGR